MFIRWLWLLTILLSSTSAWPQAARSENTSKPGVEVYGGYAYGTGNSNQSGGGFQAGVDIANLYKRIGVVGEFDLTKASSPPSPVDATYEWDFLVGPRIPVSLSKSGPIVPFVDALIGLDTFHNAGQLYTYRYSNHTSLAWALDGGLDFRLGRHFALRGQAGYLGTSLANSSDGNPVNLGSSFAGRVRIGIGGVFRF